MLGLLASINSYLTGFIGIASSFPAITFTSLTGLLQEAAAKEPTKPHMNTEPDFFDLHLSPEAINNEIEIPDPCNAGTSHLPISITNPQVTIEYPSRDNLFFCSSQLSEIANQNVRLSFFVKDKIHDPKEPEAAVEIANCMSNSIESIANDANSAYQNVEITSSTTASTWPLGTINSQGSRPSSDNFLLPFNIMNSKGSESIGVVHFQAFTAQAMDPRLASALKNSSLTSVFNKCNSEIRKQNSTIFDISPSKYNNGCQNSYLLGNTCRYSVFQIGANTIYVTISAPRKTEAARLIAECMGEDPRLDELAGKIQEANENFAPHMQGTHKESFSHKTVREIKSISGKSTLGKIEVNSFGEKNMPDSLAKAITLALSPQKDQNFEYCSSKVRSEKPELFADPVKTKKLKPQTPQQNKPANIGILGIDNLPILIENPYIANGVMLFIALTVPACYRCLLAPQGHNVAAAAIGPAAGAVVVPAGPAGGA